MPADYELMLTAIPAEQEIIAVKTLSRLFGFSLKEAKDLVKAIPQKVQVSVPRTTAETFLQEMSQLGARVSIEEIQNIKSTDTENAAQSAALDCDDRTVLNNYSLALACVDVKYYEYLNAQEKLRWCESKLEKADQLATQYKVEKASNFPGGRIPSITKFEEIQLDLNLKKLQNMLNELKQIQEEGKKTIEQLCRERQETQTELQKKLEDTEDESRGVIRKIDALKTEIMRETLYIVGGGVIAAIWSRNWIIVIIAIIGILCIRSVISNPD
jgi:DNA repair exonuclease SbcCD ATPase subunit